MSKLNKSKIAKGLFLIIAVFFMLITFTGCANVSYYVIPSADKYTQGLKVTLNQQDAIKYGYNLQNLTYQVLSIMEDEKSRRKTWFNAQLTECHNKARITDDEYLFINNLEPFQIETEALASKDGYDVYFEICVYPAQNEQYNFSIGQIINIYNYADIAGKPSGEDEDTSFVEDVGVAYLKGDTQDSPFENEDIDSLATLFLDTLGYQSYGLSKKDVTYSYQYATDSRRLHSNADKVTYNGNYYVHTWVINQDEEGNVLPEQMKFYYTLLNTKLWYWVGIAVTIVGGIIITIVLYTNNKKKSNKIQVN